MPGLIKVAPTLTTAQREASSIQDELTRLAAAARDARRRMLATWRGTKDKDALKAAMQALGVSPVEFRAADDTLRAFLDKATGQAQDALA